MTNIDDIRDRPTIRLWPETAELLGISKDLAYKGAADGTIPVIRVGRRLIVPTGRLLEMLGASNV